MNKKLDKNNNKIGKDNHHNNSNSGGWVRTCAAVLPFLTFYAVYEIVLTILQLIWQSLLSGAAGSDSLQGMLLNSPWVSAMITAISMSVALLTVIRAATGEIKAFAARWTEEERLTASEPVGILLFFLVGLCLDLGLNTLFSLTGFSNLAGSGAAAQTQVALTWGVAVYGVLTPLIEEIVFRGVVFARMVRLFDFDGTGEGRSDQEAPPFTQPETDGRRNKNSVRQHNNRFGQRHGARSFVWQGHTRTLLLCMVFSSLLFAIWHNNLPQAVLGFFLGIVLTGVYAYSGNFALPVILHGLLNVFVLVLSYTGVYNSLCRPVWCAGFLLVAAAGSVCLAYDFRRKV